MQIRWAAASLAALVALVSVVGTQVSAGGGEESARGAAGSGSRYLFIWAGDAERKGSDFLAVLDARRDSPGYGHIVATVAVGASGTMPHHTEYEFPESGELLANGWVTGRTFVLDLREPEKPRLAGSFGGVGGYTYPHSFARLPNGHILATFQSMGAAYAPPGGLVEMDETGNAVRSASAVSGSLERDLTWPYSLAVIPEKDRAVVSLTPMGMPKWAKTPEGSWPPEKTDAVFNDEVQVWRLSDLTPLATLHLPDSGSGRHREQPSEPRVLADGSVYVNTFRCGLYRITGVEASAPKAEFVYAFPGGDDDSTCGVPVVMGRYWVQTVAALPGLIALDTSDPAHPVEVSRLKLAPEFHMPHWLAGDRRGSRLVLTGGEQSWVLVVKLDAETGELRVDENFRDEKTGALGVHFTGKEWPHGGGGGAVVHGALFGPR